MTGSEEDIISNIDNLVTKIGEIDINDNTFVNIKPTEIKPEIHPEWNPNVTEIPSIYGTKPQTFDRSIRGYAGLSTVYQQIPDKYTPYDKMKGEPINPFGIYLIIDCITNVEEAIDKWETALRIVVAVNKIYIDFVKHFVERSLVNSALRYWQNLAPDTIAIIFEIDKNIANIITTVVEVLKLEFCGEGNFFKDPGTTSKYAIVLQRLQLCGICEIDRYICVFQDYYYHIYNQIPNTSSYLPLFFSKIPDPWGQKLIDTYIPGETNTLGKRIAKVGV